MSLQNHVNSAHKIPSSPLHPSSEREIPITTPPYRRRRQGLLMVAKLAKINCCQRRIRLPSMLSPMRVLMEGSRRMEGFVRVAMGEQIVLGLNFVILVLIRRAVVFMGRRLLIQRDIGRRISSSCNVAWDPRCHYRCTYRSVRILNAILLYG
jgi:hypothetical protein